MLHFYTDLRSSRICGPSIGEKHDNIRYVAAITSSRRQHRSTNIFERKIRIGRTWRVDEPWDGRLNFADCRVRVQIKLRRINNAGVCEKADTCLTAVDIQISDQLRYKFLRQVKIGSTDAVRFVQYENNVRVAFRFSSCNIILC